MLCIRERRRERKAADEVEPGFQIDIPCTNPSLERYSTFNVYGFDFKRTPTFSNPNHHVDENRFDSFYRHNYQFEEQYTKQKFFTQGKFKLKEI